MNSLGARRLRGLDMICDKEKAARECDLKITPSAITNTGPLAYRQKMTTYEALRQEWLALNPIHSEMELAAACVVIARNCGLRLLTQLKGAHHGTKP